MSAKDNGGPAFPQSGFHDTESGKNFVSDDSGGEGMSLRDYFAAKALPGVIGAIMPNEGHNWRPEDFANEAYLMADAMLKARVKS